MDIKELKALAGATSTFVPFTFRPFGGIPELEEWLKTHDWVYYHAPMDLSPHVVDVVRYCISNKDKRSNRLTLWSLNTKTFTVGMIAHFDRFRMKQYAE